MHFYKLGMVQALTLLGLTKTAGPLGGGLRERARLGAPGAWPGLQGGSQPVPPPPPPQQTAPKPAANVQQTATKAPGVANASMNPANSMGSKPISTPSTTPPGIPAAKPMGIPSAKPAGMPGPAPASDFGSAPSAGDFGAKGPGGK